MTNLLQHFSSYGLAGLLIGVIALLLYRLIDRGFEMRVPPPHTDTAIRGPAATRSVQSTRGSAV